MAAKSRRFARPKPRHTVRLGKTWRGGAGAADRRICGGGRDAAGPRGREVTQAFVGQVAGGRTARRVVAATLAGAILRLCATC